MILQALRCGFIVFFFVKKAVCHVLYVHDNAESEGMA